MVDSSLKFKTFNIEKILSHVYKQVVDLTGESKAFDILNCIDQNKCIQDLYDQIHDQR